MDGILQYRFACATCGKRTSTEQEAKACEQNHEDMCRKAEYKQGKLCCIVIYF